MLNKLFPFPSPPVFISNAAAAAAAAAGEWMHFGSERRAIHTPVPKLVQWRKRGRGEGGGRERKQNSVKQGKRNFHSLPPSVHSLAVPALPSPAYNGVGSRRMRTFGGTSQRGETGGVVVEEVILRS